MSEEEVCETNDLGQTKSFYTLVPKWRSEQVSFNKIKVQL
jgi:hypothetical protein